MTPLDPALRSVGAAFVVLLYASLCARIWLNQYRLRQHLRQEAAQLQITRTNGSPPLLLAWASQSGQAEEIAHETARLLHSAGESVHLCKLDHVSAETLAQTRRALFVVSTSGEGDAPDSAALFQAQHMGQSTAGALAHVQYGMLALGDSSYAQFCGFARALDAWLHASGAQALFARVEMDCGAPDALRRWQQRIGQITSLSDLEAIPAWQAPTFDEWTLVARQHMNPGSSGEPVYHLELQAPPDAAAHWESGDLAQVRVPADPQHPREYSIASIAQDARVHLLVRLARRDDGSPGLASGWLTGCATDSLQPGGKIAMRLRAHRNFRLEENASRALILIGNGTGLAGLRSHLRARAAHGATPNWLLFGERNAACDLLYGAEIRAWQASGVLQRLDLAFSRDIGAHGQPGRVYVQQRLVQAHETLRDWVLRRDAAIYVCGSLHGMAQGVDQALHQVLGAECMAQLLRSGRYRRDVY